MRLPAPYPLGTGPVRSFSFYWLCRVLKSSTGVSLLQTLTPVISFEKTPILRW